METDEFHEHSLAHLAEIRHQLERQNSLLRMFMTGVVYGAGFFVGSAILATIAFGIFGPWFARFDWIRNAYVSGTSLQGR